MLNDRRHRACSAGRADQRAGMYISSRDLAVERSGDIQIGFKLRNRFQAFLSCFRGLLQRAYIGLIRLGSLLSDIEIVGRHNAGRLRRGAHVLIGRLVGSQLGLAGRELRFSALVSGVGLGSLGHQFRSLQFSNEFPLLHP